MKPKTWLSSLFTSEAGEKDLVAATTFNVTKIIAIFMTALAGLTQGLTASGLTHLSHWEMITVWLTVLALIVVLGVVDMVCRAYVTAKRFSAGEAALHVPDIDVVVSDGLIGPHKGAELLGVIAGGPSPLAHVKFDGSDEDRYVPLSSIHMRN